MSLARELGRTEDGGFGRCVETTFSWRQRQSARCAADASRMEQLKVAVRGHERPAVLEEEWPLLRKEGFEDAEVEYRWILLDLGEVRVDGCRQCRAGSNAQSC